MNSAAMFTVFAIVAWIGIMIIMSTVDNFSHATEYAYDTPISISSTIKYDNQNDQYNQNNDHSESQTSNIEKKTINDFKLSMNKEYCPDPFPKQVPKLSQLTHICSNLDRFKIHGYCEPKNCSKCMPPNSLTMPWTNNDVVPFLDKYDQTIESRRNKLKSLLINNLNKLPNDDDEPIILMVFNYGYAYLFFNWVCSIENNNIDINQSIRKRTIIITTDIEAKTLVESKGFVAYYPEWLGEFLLSKIDSKAAERFALGAHRWTVSIQIVTLTDLVQLGYTVILQDSDMIWNKNPVTYLTQPQMKLYDLQVKFIFDYFVFLVLTSAPFCWM